MPETRDVRRTKITSAFGLTGALTRIDTNACRLVVLNTPSKGTSCDLRGDKVIVIGADLECGLVIDDQTVSRQHAQISRIEGGVLVEDLDSTNGTYYERSRVREVVVPFGATIGLGKAYVKVLPHETEVRTAPAKSARFGSLVGQDVRMREMFSLLADVAPTDATVVLEGETGTGKELVASALHEHSGRAKKPFVVFDCSAVPHDLVESALFGHNKGAFTGATSSRQGAFRRAHTGTIFLDEIGELPLDLQPKLLRAIESRTVQAVGGDDYQRVDVRVIVATNRNLKAEVRAGRFREDLYYRLAVVRIGLPALRDRLDDLPTLVEHFLGGADGHARFEIDERCWPAMRSYSWPGNVRELKNVVERGRSLFRGNGPMDLSQYLPGQSEILELKPDDDPAKLPPSRVDDELAASYRMALDREQPQTFKDAKNLVIEAFERRYLELVLTESGGNISRAAQAAQMDRKHLRELMKKYGLWDGAEPG